jgi:hypothetical protein
MPAISVPSPQVRRISTPRWLDLRFLAGVALVLGSVVVGADAVASARHTEVRLSAARGLAAGTVLTTSDLTSQAVQLPAASLAAYASADSQLVGRTLSVAVRKGELVPVGGVGIPAQQATLVLPLADGSAPPLGRGDRIAVWFSTPSCPLVLLINQASVEAVHGTGGYGSGDGQQVVLDVPTPNVERVVGALAIPDVELRAVLLTGAPPAGGLQPIAGCEPPASTGESQ